MIVVLHAYSRANAGDGLLVDLSLERLARVGIRPADCTVLALDAASFADLPRVVKVGTARRSVDGEMVRAAGTGMGQLAGALNRRLGFGPAAAAIEESDGLVAVGGGYLRAGTPVNMFGTAINHLPQLTAAARTGRPAVYLPQSIGPLRGPVGAAVTAALRRVDAVHVRDDRSVQALATVGGVRRTPDLVVLDVAERFDPRAVGTALDRPIVVARSLSDAPDYLAGLRSLAAHLGEVIWAVQAEGGAEKSDREFYRRAGLPAAGRLTEELGRPGAGPVVSVRLHGALQAVLRGVPAIHLGYERKSRGAYQDLGLTDWLHDARRFDPRVVADQVTALRRDPSPFWTAVERRRDQLLEASDRLTGSIRSTIGGA